MIDLFGLNKQQDLQEPPAEQAPAWEQDPAKPFANLMASQALAIQPPPMPVDSNSSPGLLSVGSTGWFALSATDVEQMLLMRARHYEIWFQAGEIRLTQ